MMQPPPVPPGAVVDDSQEGQTQQDTQQSTQQATQTTAMSGDGHLWGFLQPCSPSLTRIDFWRVSPMYKIGRNEGANDVVLPGFKVSNKHCTITWDTKEDRSSVVTVHDMSSNGTFINSVKIGKGHVGVLREGNEISFGTSQPQPHDNGIEDYRFVYRHVASGLPTTGLYAFYDICHELGKGSFATVMKAVSRSTGEFFAVKMIQDNKAKPMTGDSGNSGPRNSAFGREIAILEQLQHPNICSLKEVFFENGNINLVLELVEGGDLLDYILSRGGLKEPDARQITYQICKALAYIHSRGICHRDLKPENVLLTKEDPPTVKVADFGLAKAVDSLTMLRTMCGTPSYLAPEVVMQTAHEPGYDQVVDSWSVGVIVFSMLTNASPFIEDENQRDLRTRIAERTIDWQCLANTRCSEEAQDFCRRLLDHDPTHRMTLTQALEHVWLSGPTTPQATHLQPLAATNSSLSNFEDVSMASISDLEPFGDGDSQDLAVGVSQGLEDLQLHSISSESSTGTLATARPEREGSRVLQRRSQIVTQAKEDGAELLEPSWQMIQNAAAVVVNAAGPSNGPRGAKRVHSELTPLPEEYDDEMVMSPLGDSNSANKRGKTSDEDVKSQQPTKPARGRPKVTPASMRTTRNRAAGADAMSEDEEPSKVRRSNRNTSQKVARRA